MIDTKILDEIMPVPDRDELCRQMIAQLQDEGFPITSFKPGSIFYTILMAAIQIHIELRGLLRGVISNGYVSHAEGLWLQIKAGDYGKALKPAVKAQGHVTLRRSRTGTVIKVPRGLVFKTALDINGEELRYFAVEDTLIPAEAATARVLVEAEKAGSRYNVPPGQIIKSLTYLDGVEGIANEDGWISREGADEEDPESLRTRTLRAWSELAAKPTRDKLQNLCEGVPGVLFVTIDDDHPRGQGTTDIIVTGTAGAATPALLDAVRETAGRVAGPYDDYLVRSSETVAQDVRLRVTVPAGTDKDDVAKQVSSAVVSLLQIRKARALNELLLADLIHAAKSVAGVRNVQVYTPVADVVLAKDKVVVLGTLTVDIVWG